jgi:hypothetical protein
VRGPGSVKTQGTAGITAELVAMASDILHDPASGLRRSALAHAIREIIRTRGDEPVLRAIELAPDLRVARAIRAAAEAACEAVSVSSNGAERDARLFCVPVVVRFCEPMTTQEFDHAFTLTNWSGPFLARLHECGARHSISFILPHVFVFDDLARLSFCDVRNGTIMASATGARMNGGMITPFPISTPPQRRSATFLRYLVGYQVKGGGMPDHSAEDRARFGACVRSVMRASMPGAQDVAVIYTGYFYEPIWEGLWVYHIHRLGEVVRTIAASEWPPSGLTSSIAVTGSRSERAAEVAFFCRGKRVGHHAYRIPTRPLADPKSSAARIAAELRTLGVKRYVATAGATVRGADRPSTDRRSSAARKGAANELTIPL